MSMNPIADYPFLIDTLILGSVLCFWIFISIFISIVFVHHEKTRFVIPLISAISLSYIVFQLSVHKTPFFINCPFIVGIGLVLLGTGGVFACGFYSMFRHRERITAVSVNESIETLTTGVCVYYPGGRIIMQNNTMKRLCLDITGKSLFNGVEFCAYIFNMQSSDNITVRKTAENIRIVQFADGRAYRFALTEIRPDEAFLCILATDISEEYQDTEILHSRQLEAEKLNRSLRDVRKGIRDHVAAQEILNAKIRIHDELGACLLASKRFLLHGGPEDERNDILATLNRTINLLESSDDEEKTDEIEMIKEVAADVGVSLVITGQLPAEERLRALLAVALHESLTNTIRHAHGHEVYLELSEAEGVLTAQITNSGDAPGEEIKEKGGLVNLRLLTEKEGGTMLVESSPVFRIILNVPEDKNGL